MRGKAQNGSERRSVHRITPAYAGKSPEIATVIVQPQDHPRLCGEKGDQILRLQQPCRITPAYAGKSGRVCGLKICRRDHPRLCGEKFNRISKQSGNPGSPPPMRGKGWCTNQANSYTGITPAYAGKSLLVNCFCVSLKDHPRLCGEKIFQKPSGFLRHGSPPPMRGKGGAKKYCNRYHRITPAYAGKSCGERTSQSSCQDHPRLCGEKTKKIPKQRYFFHQSASFSFSLQYT